MTRPPVGLLARLLCRVSSLLFLVATVHASVSGDLRICPRKSPLLNPALRLCAAVLDDEAVTESWEPWAYPPYCVGDGRVDRTHRAQQDDLDDLADVEETSDEAQEGEEIKYCLYTSTFFGNHGISILARPEAAAEAAETVWSTYHSSFPDRTTVQYLNPEPACEVVDMPDKGGKGVVARRRIRRKETFLVDYAAITGDLDLWGFASQYEGHELLEMAADQLVDPDAVRTMSHGAGGEGVEAVMRSNTFRTYLNGVSQKALFPKISRINHSCKPNSIIRFPSVGGLAAGVGALRDIEPGEEITISYIAVNARSEVRETQLRQWGFDCSCEACSAPARELDASDERRAALSTCVDDMVQALSRGDIQGGIKTLRTALDDLEAEGLTPLAGEVYEGLATIYWVTGDKAKAMDMARTAVEYRADFGAALEPRNKTRDLEYMLARMAA